MSIHNGIVEGLNNKAKVISHKAYGFRTAGNYIRNLYHCMTDLPLPETVHTIAEAHRELAAYFERYNFRRRHQGIGRRTPDSVYWATLPG